MACINKLSGNISFDCEDKPKKGIFGSNAVLINFEDIDFGATTMVGATITNLVLNAGATGYQLEWYKELASANGAYTPNAEEIDGFSQGFLGRLSTTSAMNAERARELSKGRFVIAYESKYQGVSQLEAFKVLGIEAGLELTEMTTSTTENSGSILFTLATKEGDYEDYPYSIYLEPADVTVGFEKTAYEVTKASVAALFTAVV